MQVQQSQLARIFGVTSRTIRDWHDAGLEEARDPESGTYNLAQAVQWRIELERERVAQAGLGDSDYEEARARLTAAKAEREEDALRRDRGTLIPAEEVVAKVREPLEEVDARLRAAPREHAPEWVDRLGVGHGEAVHLLGEIVEPIRADLRRAFDDDDAG